MPSISIVVPVLNEGAEIARILRHLGDQQPDELIVADGGSTDGTLDIARGLATVIVSKPGRGVQMNAGARAARSDILLFIHADCRLGPGALDAVRSAVENPAVTGGSFDLRFEGAGRAPAIFTAVDRLRRRCGVVYGDAGIFCRRTAFDALGGYRDWPLMEDYEFARRLRRHGTFVCLDAPIWTSDRRWRKAGLSRTLASWILIQGLYSAGVPPRRLARFYRHIR